MLGGSNALTKALLTKSCSGAGNAQWYSAAKRLPLQLHSASGTCCPRRRKNQPCCIFDRPS